MEAAGEKCAVVLMNLGGPDSLESVQPYLFNLFFDKNIINLPTPMRWVLAKIISSRRAPTAREIYRQIGGRSPLLPETMKQAQSLQKVMGNSQHTRVFVAMRHWHPMTQTVVQEVREFGPERIFLLPLYPQFSTSTSGSSFQDWDVCARRAGLNAPTTKLCCCAQAPEFIEAHVDLIMKEIEGLRASVLPRILFSAHGLPQKQSDAGDPYLWQIENTTREIVSALKLKTGQDQIDHEICFQSKVGPLKWLEPSTRDALRRAGQEGKAIMVVPIAFVSEHSETLVELDIEYKAYAKTCGVKQYHRVPALGAHPLFIGALANFVRQAYSSSEDFRDQDCSHCPEGRGRCHLSA